jgi:ankyrin repeat protein
MYVLASMAATVALSVASVGAPTTDTGLIEAVQQKDLPKVSALLHQHAPVNTPQADGSTALHWAAYKDAPEIVVALLKAGADPNVANELGVTPLFLACENGNEAIVGRLLQANANPNAAVSSGETPLMAATRRGYAPVVRQLLRRGANVHAKESWHGQTALMWAAAGAHSSIVRMLLEAGGDVKARTTITPQVINDARGGGAAVGTGSKMSNSDYGEVLLGGFTSLLFAAREGDAESAELLLNAKADVNEVAADGSSALVIAVHSGNVPVAKVLLDRGADPNLSGAGYTALHAAVLRGQVELLGALLAHGADPNPRITKALGKRDSAEFTFGVDAISATPLLLAATYLDLNAMRALLGGGADSSLTKADGTNLLLAAVGRSRFDKTGGQFGGVKTDPRRGRALSTDEARQFPEGEREEDLIVNAVQLILQSGADVSASDKSGSTGLHRAAQQSLNRVIRFLVEHGADVNVKNGKGQTPLTVALSPNAFNLDGTEASKPDPSTAELLRRLGAKEQRDAAPER